MGGLLVFLLNVPFTFPIPPHPFDSGQLISDNKRELVHLEVQGCGAGGL